MKTRITVLGCGTSTGVPVLGCRCPVCSSSDPRDHRMRSSILVEKGNTRVVIDTGYEFRLQCLRAGITGLDAVLYTHSHPDHLFGFDDLRMFSQKKDMPVYASEDDIAWMRNKFPYAFSSLPGSTLPRLECHSVKPLVPFRVGELEFLPIEMVHGKRKSMGYRFGRGAYLTDVSDIQLEKNGPFLKNLDVMIIDGLMEKGHVAHYSFSEARDVALRLGAERPYFTHMGHSLFFHEIEERYAPVRALYDTMVLEVEDE